MDASGDFAGCIQTFNDVASSVKNVTLSIDNDTAHGVVRGRSHQTDGEESVIEMIGLGDVLSVLVLVCLTDGTVSDCLADVGELSFVVLL